MRRNSPTARVAGRIVVAAAVAAAPLFTAAAAMAAPAPGTATDIAAAPGVRLADYDDWYHWHCDVMHEWWRPRCHPGPVNPGGPLIPAQPSFPTGSAA